MTPIQKSLVMLFCVALSACGSKKAAPAAGPAAPPKAEDGTNAPKVGTATASTAKFLLPSTLVSTQLLQARPGHAFVPDEIAKTNLPGFVCMQGELKKELIPNAVRYTLESSIVEIASGADGELWNRHTITLRTVVATSKTMLESPDVTEDFKSLSTKEFAEKCGSQYVASTYNGAVLSSSMTYDVAAAEAVPSPAMIHVDGSDAENIRKLGETYEELVKQAKAYKTAKVVDTTLRQEPMLLFGEDVKDFKLIDSLKLFAEKASKIKTPYDPAFLGLVEVAPYPIVTK